MLVSTLNLIAETSLYKVAISGDSTLDCIMHAYEADRCGLQAEFNVPWLALVREIAFSSILSGGVWKLTDSA